MVHPIFVRGIGQDRVQTQAATARLPLRAMRMIEESFHKRPARARVVRTKKRCWFNATEQRIRVVLVSLFDLPDLL